MRRLKRSVFSNGDQSFFVGDVVERFETTRSLPLPVLIFYRRALKVIPSRPSFETVSSVGAPVALALEFTLTSKKMGRA